MNAEFLVPTSRWGSSPSGDVSALSPTQAKFLFQVAALEVLNDLGRLAEMMIEGDIVDLDNPAFKIAMDRQIQMRHELQDLKGAWIEQIEEQRASGEYSLYEDFAKDQDRIVFKKTQEGAGGCYIGYVEGVPTYVVKPVDEDVGLYNNPHNSDLMRVSGEISEMEKLQMGSYRAFARDQLVFDLAKALDCENCVPETVIGLVSCPEFVDRFARFPTEVQKILNEQGLGPEKEKICTIQRFVPGSENLIDLRFSCGIDPFTGKCFTQDSFEGVSALMTLSGEEDGHEGNLLGVVVNEEGQKRIDLFKIDSSYTFYPQSAGYGHYYVLLSFPQANRPYSESMCSKVAQFDLESFIERMRVLKFTEPEIQTFRSRFERFKQDVEAGRSIKQVNRHLGVWS